MLSPVVITISKGNRARSAAICAATSYDGWSPVPKSPMTANLSESVLFGSPRLTPRALGTDPATAIATNHLRANRRQRAVATITARSPPSRVGEKVQMPNRARVRRRFPSATSVPRLQRRAFPALAVRCGKIPPSWAKTLNAPTDDALRTTLAQSASVLGRFMHKSLTRGCVVRGWRTRESANLNRRTRQRRKPCSIPSPSFC